MTSSDEVKQHMYDKKYNMLLALQEVFVFTLGHHSYLVSHHGHHSYLVQPPCL